MRGVHGWASRMWFHVATLLEKPDVPGSIALTVPALLLVVLYLVFIWVR